MKLVPMKYLKSRVCNLATAGLVITIVGIVMAVYGFPQIIKCHISQQVSLKNGTEGFEMWTDMPFPLTFKVYIFNVTNPEEVSTGAKPNLEEIGPYIYDQHREKNNFNYPGNDTISYEMKKIFRFNANASMPLTESDTVTVLNVALLGIVTMANKLMPSMLSTLNGLIPQLFNEPTDPFVRTSVGDLLFNGILINCSSNNMMVGMACDGMKSRLPPTMRQSDDDDPSEGYYFSMFYHINNTYDGPFTISRGIDYPERLGNIVSYKNKSDLESWTDDCSVIKGTDTTIFAPMDESIYPKIIYIFQSDVCRVMYAEYVHKKTVFNLQAFRYETTKRVLGSYKTNPDNKCYCPENWSTVQDGCSLDGVQNLEPCQGAPVIASFPHFYLGDPALREYVANGMNPDKEKHGTFVEIEPKTGAALRGAKRIQFNIEIRNFKDITVLSSVTPGLFPIMWIEESAEVNDKVQRMLSGVHDKIKFIKVVQWIIVAIGIILLMATCHYKRRGYSDRWSWSPNRVDLDVPSYGASMTNNDMARPAGAQKEGRLQYFGNQAFTSTELVAHK